MKPLFPGISHSLSHSLRHLGSGLRPLPVALGIAILCQPPVRAEDTAHPPLVDSRCPADGVLTDRVVADAAGISEALLAAVKAARTLDNDAICQMPADKLQRAIWRTRNPKPDHPGEWARFRSAQQTDESGTVKPDGLIEAVNQRAQMLAQSPAPQAAGISRGTWTALGPGNIGGRVRALLIHPTNASTMWAGSVAGGLWKTTTAGAAWTPVNDFMGNLSIASLVMSPTNPNLLYAGTGEGFYNGDAVRGAGIFKSADGGTTWTQVPSTKPTTADPQWYHVNRLAIHPTNPSIMLAATNKGLYRSTDAGTTWTLRYSGRVADVRFNPLNGSRVVLAPGLGGGAVAVSADAGTTWNRSNLDSTPPSPGNAGRVELAFSRQNGVLYASVDAASGQIYRSSDNGITWTLQGSPAHLGGQGWYDNALWVDPVNSNHLITGGVDLHRSSDGGATWTKISEWWKVGSGSVHADHHTIVSSPQYNGTTNSTVYFGNDGGVYKAQSIQAVTTTTTGWTALNNGLGITQFYSGAGHSGLNGRIIGGTQDNGSIRYAGTGSSWTAFFGGDGGFSAIDPTDGNYIYGEYVYLQIHRSTNGGTTASSYIHAGLSDAANNTANFIAPFLLDPNNPSTMIAGGQSVWRSTNVKAATPTWSVIQPPTAGGGEQNYTSQIAVAQGASHIIWVGKNNGSLYKTTTGTAVTPAWSQVGAGALPNGRMVLSLLIDRSNPNVVYVGFGGYSNPNLYKTTNGGTTWTSIGAGLPASPVRTIQRHPTRPNFLYVGTEVGVYTSENGGTTWSTTNDGPANVSVEQMFWLNDSTLVAATHGRGMFKSSVPIDYLLSVGKTGNGTVTSTPAGITCGTTCSALYAASTSVKLTAKAATGATFAGWSGACTGTALTCTVSMTGAKSVSAKFK